MTPEEARKNLIASLAEVRRRFENDAPDWEYALLNTFKKYALAIGVDKELVQSIQALLHVYYDRLKVEQGEKRKNEKSVNLSLAWGYASAAVTALLETGAFPTIPKAERQVSQLSGIDSKKLHTFRLNILRRKAPKDAVTVYEEALAKFRTGDGNDILATVVNLRPFVKVTPSL